MGYVFGTTRAIPSHCGLTTYILANPSDNSTKNYNTLTWYADIASALL